MKTMIDGYVDLPHIIQLQLGLDMIKMKQYILIDKIQQELFGQML